MALHSRPELEEERRLFYVALTRAEKLATLSYATSRYRYGNIITSEPSRFIEEINAEFLDIANPSRSRTVSIMLILMFISKSSTIRFIRTH